jgi:di/tricarboxylate transporter
MAIVLTLAVTVVALALFVWNRLRVDVVALLVMTALIVLGLVTPQQGISGFANEATVTVGLMLVLATGLVRTGVIDAWARWARRTSGESELRFLIVLIVFAMVTSAFVNNTPVVLLLMPVALSFSKQMNVPPSRLLMPLSFASQLGGTLTLIGTSTNLLVAGLVLELGLERIRLFDITGPAAVLALLGSIYLLTVGRWLLPARDPAPELLSRYELREYLAGVRVTSESSVGGRTLADLRFEQRYGLQVLAIERDGARISFPSGGARLRPGDLLLVRGAVARIAELDAEDGLEIAHATPDVSSADQPDEGPLAEILVPPRSRFLGRTIRDLGFRARYGLTVLGFQRHGAPRHDPVPHVRLEAGDILLVQGATDALAELHARGDLALLGELDVPVPRRRKARLALPIMAGVVIAAAIGVSTIMVAALVGVVLMLLTGCIQVEEAYRDVDWGVLVLLGAIIPLGIAMRNTGTADFIATHILALALPLGLYGTLAAFYLLTSLLTEVISNNAAAVVLTPIVVATAATLGVSPYPFVVAVMIAASNSFMTPIGYQTNAFIFGPGGYRFSDYLRVGGPLNILLAAAATFVIPVFFPF